MAYIKCGIITKISIEKNRTKAMEYISNSFNTELFNRYDDNYYLKKDILNNNIESYREEFMSYTNFYGDSLCDCEAYCLETTIDNVIKSKIVLCQRNEKYYFSGYSLKFNTDEVIMTTNKFSIKLFMIPIFWDVYRIIAEDFEMISVLVNNLIRKCMTNPLKDASFFSVV